MTAAAALEKFWSDDRFATEVSEKARYLGERLGAIAEEHGLSVKGRGMMVGIDAGSGENAAAICKACFAKGLIIETSGSFDEVVKVLCPLTISLDQLTAGIDIMETAFDAVLGSRRAAAE
ncbi:Diaminobutyrate--2-oxoglutarate transaminase [compost metagenome]